MGNSRRLLVLSLLIGGFSSQMRAQNVSVSPTGLSFGTVPLQQTSAARPILLTNNGSNPLQISSMVASGAYAQTNNCPLSLPALANCTINVTFNAGSTLGPIIGSLSIFDDD